MANDRSSPLRVNRSVAVDRSAPFRTIGEEPVKNTYSYVRAHPWLFVNFILCLFVFAPEVRRLIDWRVGFTETPILIAVPLFGLLVPALDLFYSPKRAALVPRSFARICWIYLGGFIVACVVGLGSGNGIGALFSLCDFTLPAIFGAWLSTTQTQRSVLYDKIADFSFNLTSMVSVYGIYQFAVLPGWDRLWLAKINAESFGSPYPFQFRAFSTLNGPATFSDLLVGVLLLNMPRISKGGIWTLLRVSVIVVALLLTRERADWIAAILGLIAFVAISPGRVRNLGILGALATITLLFAFNAQLLFGTSQAGDELAERFSSFSDLDRDTSFRVRQQYVGVLLSDALAQPIGSGLGIVGAGARFDSSNNGVFDNGYVARLTEMGYFGFACFVASIIAAMVVAFRRWSFLNRIGDREHAAIVAAAIAIQIAVDFADVSGDHHNALDGVLFWMSFALIFDPLSKLVVTSDARNAVRVV